MLERERIRFNNVEFPGKAGDIVTSADGSNVFGRSEDQVDWPVSGVVEINARRARCMIRGQVDPLRKISQRVQQIDISSLDNPIRIMCRAELISDVEFSLGRIENTRHLPC